MPRDLAKDKAAFDAAVKVCGRCFERAVLGDALAKGPRLMAIQAGRSNPSKPEKDPIIGFLETKCGCVPQTPSSPTVLNLNAPRSLSALETAWLTRFATVVST
jgi:hypothetical protein